MWFARKNKASELQVMLVILVLALMIAPLAYAILSKQRVEEVAETTNQELAIAQPVKVWQPYTNLLYGYELNYPQDWGYQVIHTKTLEEIEEGYRTIFWSDTNFRNILASNQPTQPMYDLTVEYNDRSRDSLLASPGVTLINSEKIMIDGVEGAKDQYLSGEKTWNKIYIPTKKTIYSISYDEDLPSSIYKTVEQMINSFHFLPDPKPITISS